MNHFFKKLSASFVLALVLGLALVFGIAAATGTRRPLPETWGTANAGFALDISGVPTVNIAGVNSSGITTNRQFLGGTGVTNTMVIKNGIVTAIQ